MVRTKKGGRRRWLILLAVVVVLAVGIPAGILIGGKLFTAQEHAVRTDWSFETGAVVARLDQWQVDLAQAPVGDGIQAFQLVPRDLEEEGFTYYDLGVQERLEGALESLKEMEGMEWTATAPLAVLNPYGTGSNGLYLYFKTERPTQVSYTVETEGDPVFTAVAADPSGADHSTVHEFQLIGLVPGETNSVSLTMTGSWGRTRQVVHFTVDMPQTSSEYPARLEVEQGPSAAEQSEGLFTMMRVNGYLGYGFFFDDAGVLRYEMVLEGYGFDRLLPDGDGVITCVSSSKLARIDGLGRVTAVYSLGEYDLHHDIGFGQTGEVLALAEERDGETVEDQLLSVDLDSGEVRLLVDFRELLSGYFAMSRPVGATDDFFWQAGEWDWLHLNSLDYLPEEDSLLLSSRETSAILKVEDLHGVPTLAWIAGDARFWADTPYAGYCLAQVGDFVPQYGQHCVEYLAPGPKPGVYTIALYNNNYWSLNSRDFQLEVDGSVGVELYGDEDDVSQCYVYQIDENAGTYALADSFEVPYSSIVSNASLCPSGESWVVNSGVSMVFGEYDAGGALIRSYAYPCTMQNYRTFKYEMPMWFR